MAIVPRGESRDVVVDAAKIKSASALGSPDFPSAPPSRGNVAMTAASDTRRVRRHAVGKADRSQPAAEIGPVDRTHCDDETRHE